MRTLVTINLTHVQSVYSGAEGQLWELLMGEQIHIGGLGASLDLAQRGGIAAGSRGVDLCCCTGAGMRLLVRYCNVARMRGVDVTAAMVDLGRQYCRDGGLAERIDLHLAQATDTGLASGAFDFVWGEDAWCYVADKHALVREAARLIGAGGTIALADWCQGPAGLDDLQARRFMTFMKFPSLATLDDYAQLLAGCDCDVQEATDTGRFPAYADLYLDMLNKQLTYDALKRIGFDQSLLGTKGDELGFVRQLAQQGRIVQGRFIARKRG
ncbi:MAG: class I SAM-dependent methyltransferase [Phycisphaeraceae bacterium]